MEFFRIICIMSTNTGSQKTTASSNYSNAHLNQNTSSHLTRKQPPDSVNYFCYLGKYIKKQSIFHLYLHFLQPRDHTRPIISAELMKKKQHTQ